MSGNAIASVEYAQLGTAPDHRGRTSHGGPGEVVTMEGGARWFHPYGGGAPTQLDETTQGLRIRRASPCA